MCARAFAVVVATGMCLLGRPASGSVIAAPFAASRRLQTCPDGPECFAKIKAVSAAMVPRMCGYELRLLGITPASGVPTSTTLAQYCPQGCADAARVCDPAAPATSAPTKCAAGNDCDTTRSECISTGATSHKCVCNPGYTTTDGGKNCVDNDAPTVTPAAAACTDGPECMAKIKSVGVHGQNAVSAMCNVPVSKLGMHPDGVAPTTKLSQYCPQGCADMTKVCDPVAATTSAPTTPAVTPAAAAAACTDGPECMAKIKSVSVHGQSTVSAMCNAPLVALGIHPTGVAPTTKLSQYCPQGCADMTKVCDPTAATPAPTTSAPTPASVITSPKECPDGPECKAGLGGQSAANLKNLCSKATLAMIGLKPANAMKWPSSTPLFKYCPEACKDPKTACTPAPTKSKFCPDYVDPKHKMKCSTLLAMGKLRGFSGPGPSNYCAVNGFDLGPILGTRKGRFFIGLLCPTSCKIDVMDACGVCSQTDHIANNSTCADCEGVPNGDKVRDMCGVCGGDGSTCAVSREVLAQRLGAFTPGTYLHILNSDDGLPTTTAPQVFLVGDPDGQTHIGENADGSAAVGVHVTVQSKAPHTFTARMRFEVYSGADCALQNMKFTSQTVVKDNKNGGKGAVVYSNNGQVAITGCLFISNFAHEGGAIYNEALGDRMTISGSYFKGNGVTTGLFGGAIKNTVSAHLIIDTTTFEANGAKPTGGKVYFGGAIYNDGNSLLITDSCTFKNNVAMLGGQLGLSSARLQAFNTTFYGAHGETRKGAIYWKNCESNFPNDFPWASKRCEWPNAATPYCILGKKCPTTATVPSSS